MAIIKCKMCGGDLNIIEGLSVAECEYCGSKQTIPTADNEKKMTLFTRASRLLRGCEFDKAAGVFENIVAEFPEEAEAYWGLVLCKYGIEYVDDPATGKKVPTCHRSSFESVLDDVNFELACENTDAVARRLYRTEARQIEELRRAIIEVSGKEDPYDLFISYKETDEHGERTLDSVIAQDIYDAFTQEAYRVFFSRISLEDKLGVEYEPYIFAALNSANVMLVVGTDYENFDSVWVKNEWSRFLKLMSQDKNKHLIPVYKNMDPYDMPKEFVKLAAQDMGKLGAMQDLVRGVKKLAGEKKAPVEEKRETVVIQQSGGANVTAIVKRGYMALEDKNWNDAAGYFDRVLDMDAECAEAYLGLFLIENNSVSPKAFVALILKQNEDCEVIVLEACPEDTERMQRIVEENYVLPHYQQRESIEKLFPFDRTYESSTDARSSQLVSVKAWLEQNKNLVRAFKFADGEALEILLNMQNGIISGLQSRVDKAKAEDEDNIARIKADYAEHLDMVEAEAKRQRVEAEAQCEADYVAACEYADRVNTEHLLLDAAQRFTAPKLRDYKDCAQRAEACKQRAEKIKAERIAAQEAERQRILAEKEAERQRVPAEKEAERQRKAAEKEERKRLAAEEAERKRALARERRIEAAAKAKKIVVALCVVGVLAAAGVFLIPKAIEIAPSVIEKMEQGKEVEEKTEKAETQEENEIQEPPAAVDMESLRTERKQVISASSACSVGLKSDGTVTLAGDVSHLRDEVGAWSDIVSVYTTGRAVIGLKSDGTVVAAGLNTNSQLNVNDWTDIIDVSAGENHTVGLKSDGTVVAVGYNQNGECDVSDWTDIVDVSASSRFTVGLKSDGTVVAAGQYSGYNGVKAWSDIVAISTGNAHTLGLKSDGTVIAAGDNNYGQRRVNDWTDIVSISAGECHSVGLRADGTVVAVGLDVDGQCDVSGWTDIVAISAGSNHTLGLKADGTVLATGRDTYGSCASVSEWADIKMPGVPVESNSSASEITGLHMRPETRLTNTIFAGTNHTLAIKADGTVVAAGFSDSNMRNMSGLTDVVSLSSGDQHTVVLKPNGKVAVVHASWSGMYTLDLWHSLIAVDRTWSDIIAVSSDSDHTIGLRSYGTVVAEGNNGYGQCDVSGWRDITYISTNSKHTVGLKSDGTVVAVGDNKYGQCDVSEWTDMISVAAGTNHTIGLKSDGTVVAVGHNSSGQCDVSEWTDMVSVAAGTNHTVGLKSDGTVVAVGYNKQGQCDVSDWANIVAISSTANHTVGLKADGTVVAVGSNTQGQCDVSDWTDIMLPEGIEVQTEAGESVAGISWELSDDGTLTISGNGRMEDYTVRVDSKYPAPWFAEGVRENIRKLVINPGITYIGENAFAMCPELREAQLPEGLLEIGDSAFSRSENLRTVVLPSTLTSIGEQAFNWCFDLVDVNLPESLQSMGRAAFNDCNSLGSIIIPEGIERIPDSAFSNCDSLSEVVLPSTLKGIGIGAFESTRSLSEINIPEGVTTLDLCSFFNSNISKIKLPASLEFISGKAFGVCKSLRSVEYMGTEEQWDKVKIIAGGNEPLLEANIEFAYIAAGTAGDNISWTLDSGGTLCFTGKGEMKDYQARANEHYNPWDHSSVRKIVISEGISSISHKAFDCFFELKEVVLPQSLESIDSQAFYMCTSLRSIEIPGSVKQIGGGAFRECSNLQSVSIRMGCEKIGLGAFQNCASLSSISIPCTVTEIGENAFDGCSRLYSVEFEGAESQWRNIVLGPKNDALLNANIEFTAIAVGEAGKNISWLLDNDGTLSIIGTGALDASDWKSEEYKNSIRKLVISSGITSIGNSAFAYCENLQEAVLQDDIETIGSFAFCGTALRELALPAGLESIGASAFDSCTSLYSVEFFPGIKNIDLSAFNNCTSLRTVKFNGTEKQWNNISIALKNDPLRNATITFEG